MKEAAVVIIKPDGIRRNLVGEILSRFAQTGLEIGAMRIVRVTRVLAEEHYRHIKGQPFFEGTVSYFSGNGSGDKQNKLLAILYSGENAIKECRRIAGITNPLEADPNSIRGSYGRITKDGVFENVVHVSSTLEEAKREIKLWFRSEDITIDLFEDKPRKTQNLKKKVRK